MTRFSLAIAFTVVKVFAHCDSLDGPVVQAAQRALDKGDVNLVLPWAPPSGEQAIRNAFRTAQATGKPTPFFEAAVRIHRAGEGAPYDGLKPAGSVSNPALAAADRAVAAKTLKPLAQVIEITDELRQRFQRVLAKSSYPSSDVAAGREYVKAYVEFIHYAEKLHSGAGHSH